MSKGQETSLQQTQSPEGSATLNYRNLGLTTFVSVLLVSLGLFMVLVGAIIAGIILYLALAASVLENRGVGSAIGRSRQLVSGRWVKTFVLLAGWLVFANLISIFAGGFVALALPSTLFGTEIVNFVQNLILALLFPFVSASMLVLYRSSTSSMFHQQVARAPPSPYDSMKPEPMWNSTSSSTSRSPFPAPPPFPGAEQRFCSNCGVKLSTDEKFCHNCGSAVART